MSPHVGTHRGIEAQNDESEESCWLKGEMGSLWYWEDAGVTDSTCVLLVNWRKLGMRWTAWEPWERPLEIPIDLPPDFAKDFSLACNACQHHLCYWFDMVWLAFENVSWACSSHLFKHLPFPNQKSEKHFSCSDAEQKHWHFNLDLWYIISTRLTLSFICFSCRRSHLHNFPPKNDKWAWHFPLSFFAWSVNALAFSNFQIWHVQMCMSEKV